MGYNRLGKFTLGACAILAGIWLAIGAVAHFHSDSFHHSGYLLKIIDVIRFIGLPTFLIVTGFVMIKKRVCRQAQ